MANGLLDGAVAMWPLNNNVGDSLDVYASGGGGVAYPFKHEAGATISINGLFLPGFAKNFGTDSANRMSYEDSVGQVFAAGDNDFSVGCWVRAIRTQNSPYIAKFPNDGTNNSWQVRNLASSNSHELVVSSDGTTNTIVGLNNPDTTGSGPYQLVVCGYDSVTEEIWISVDGSAKTRVAHTGGAFASGNSDLTLGWLGSFIMGNHDQDETAYWDIQLSDAKIQSIWNSGAGLRMTEWDATVPEQDGSQILTSLTSYFNYYEASGQNRVDLHSGDNTMAEAGAGAPIDQGIGLPAIAKTTASVDFSSNPGSLEYLEKVTPVGMNNGAGSFTVAGMFEFDHNEGDFQGLISRWLASTDQRQFMLYVNSAPSALIQFNTNDDGLSGGTTGAVALEDFTLQNPSGSQVRYIVGWYDGDLDTTNIQLSNGIVVTTAGPASVFTATIPFRVGYTNNAVDQPLVGQAAFVGYWQRVLNQLERTFLFNFFGGQPYEALVAADQGGGAVKDQQDFIGIQKLLLRR